MYYMWETGIKSSGVGNSILKTLASRAKKWYNYYVISFYFGGVCMFKVNDYVIYKNDTCIIKNTKNMRGRDYYSLSPIDDLSLNIAVPIENNLGHIRSIISKSEVEQIISSIPMVECIEFENEKMFESEYKRILASGKYEDLIKIIKTSFLRNDARLLNNKRISEKDDFYFKKAEKILYNEFSIALGLTYDETKKYVIDRVTKLSNKKS